MEVSKCRQLWQHPPGAGPPVCLRPPQRAEMLNRPARVQPSGLASRTQTWPAHARLVSLRARALRSAFTGSPLRAPPQGSLGATAARLPGRSCRSAALSGCGARRAASTAALPRRPARPKPGAPTAPSGTPRARRGCSGSAPPYSRPFSPSPAQDGGRAGPGAERERASAPQPAHFRFVRGCYVIFGAV